MQHPNNVRRQPKRNSWLTGNRETASWNRTNPTSYHLERRGLRRNAQRVRGRARRPERLVTGNGATDGGTGDAAFCADDLRAMHMVSHQAVPPPDGGVHDAMCSPFCLAAESIGVEAMSASRRSAGRCMVQGKGILLPR
mmetsp:Transcript_3064/g.6103  ORF Transcript_3064/g.6103 Transcript_3064/m.6103 type:complete len:139 (-) Transcript_3064:177-593(-)